LTLSVVLEIKYFLHPNDHFVKTVDRSVLSVADEGPFLIFGNKADALLVDLQRDGPLHFFFLLEFAGRKRSVDFPPSNQFPINLISMERFATDGLPPLLLLHVILYIRIINQKKHFVLIFEEGDWT
jgi:hypothetical protein